MIVNCSTAQCRRKDRFDHRSEESPVRLSRYPLSDVVERSSGSMNYHSNSSQLHMDQNIEQIKTSLDRLTQWMVHHQRSSSALSTNGPSLSLIDRLRRFFTSFNVSSTDPTKLSDATIDEECCRILERHRLTKSILPSLYDLSDRNDAVFLHWLRTIMPEQLLPFLLNYVKHGHTISPAT